MLAATRFALRLTVLSLAVAAAPAVSAQISIGGYTFDDNAGPDRVTALPGSHPEFNGASSACSANSANFPGLTLDESLAAVMLSNDVKDWVQGRAVMRLDFEDNVIVNLPGPDLVVFEIGGAENFRLSVFQDAICEWSSPRTYTVAATGHTVGCGPPDAINARAIDLDDFGILPGATVRSLLLENLGTQGGAIGSDLAQVMALNSILPQIGTPTCLLDFQQGIAGLKPVAWTGTDDTCLASDFPTVNYASAPLEYVDSDTWRALLVRFNDVIGGAPWQVPAGAQIRSATLHIASGPGAGASVNTHFVHRLLQPWNVNTITYANGFGGNGIDKNDVEATVAPVGTISPMGANARQAVNVTAAVQAWADGAPNHGLALLPGGPDGLGLHLSEAAVATLRPALSIVLEPKLNYAEAVHDFSPVVNGNSPAAIFLDPTTALGPPDYDPSQGGGCNPPLPSSVTLGSGGSITLEFLTASIAGSGTPEPDLWIYEVGPDVEATYVELSVDAVTWHPVGKVSGATSSVDIDAFGFGPQHLFRYIRLTDDPLQGDTTGCSPGADIDAVAALSANPWVNLGQGLAGSNGTPWFAASGALLPGGPIQFTVGSGPSFGTAWLLMGTNLLNAPFKGGTMVPDPLVTLSGLPLNGSGGIVLPAAWPVGIPAGFDIVIQFWMADGGGPQGYSATNALKSKTL